MQTVEKGRLAMVPGDAEAWRRLSGLRRDDDTTGEALVAIGRAAAIDGSRPRDLREAASIYLARGDAETAFRLLDAATAIGEWPRDTGDEIVVIWRRAWLYRAIESGFMQNVLLGDLGRPVRHVCIGTDERPPLAPLTILVVLGTESADGAALAAAHAAGRGPIGVVHMGDERGDRDKSFYGHACFVLRHYASGMGEAHPMPAGTVVQWIPNGYANGIGPRPTSAIVPATSRRFLCTFMGYPSQDPSREELTGLLEADQLPCAYVPTPAFSAGYPPSEYAIRLEDSVFALAPRGHAVESIRFFDALERGCIPVVVEASFADVGGPMSGAPIVRLSRWGELKGFLDGILALKEDERRAQLLRMQRDAIAWWTAEKTRWQAKVRRVVQQGFGLG